MNILFLMICFPDPLKNPNLYTELATYAQEQGNQIYVATLADRSLGERAGYQREGSLHVLRIEAGSIFQVNFLQKAMTTIRIPALFLKEIKKYFKHIRFDMVIYPTPPITFAPVVQYIKKRDNCLAYLILRDIFPQNAKDLGIINNRLLFAYFRRKEQKLYHLSDRIGCMSPKNMSYIQEHNQLPTEKLELLPNWRKIGALQQQRRESFRQRWQLEQKFVAIFGGNIGKPQELPFLLQLAELCQAEERQQGQAEQQVIFLIVGEGQQKQEIAKQIERKKLNNVLLKDPLSSQEYDALLRECDLGLINLHRNFSIPNIPSKALAYFEAGLPILAALDSSTDFGQILSSAGAGLFCLTGDITEYKKRLDELRQSPSLRREMGAKGRRLLEEQLRVEQAYQTIWRHLLLQEKASNKESNEGKAGEEQHDQKVI